MRISAPFPQTRDKTSTRSPKRFGRWVALAAGLIVIKQGALTVAVSGSGAVAAARTVALPFQQTGTVTSVDVKVGDTAKAGQTLAMIDPADRKLALQQG